MIQYNLPLCCIILYNIISCNFTFENLLTIRPNGVVSKKDIGAYSTAFNISRNNVRPAFHDFKRAYSSRDRAKIEMKMFIKT